MRAAASLGTCLVIGGAGMLGFQIARRLLGEGVPVRVLDREPLPEELPIGATRRDALIGDIRDPGAVRRACQGVDTVIQTAAAVWNVRTPRGVYDEVNVRGNRVVLEECRRRGIRRFVYTSSMDVVVDGRAPIVEGDESLPYPARLPRDAYSRSKIVSERMVLAANGPDLATCVLRPVGMYGPRDKYHLGTIVAMARKGVSLRLGDGSARFSHAYAENVAHAHVLAARRLWPGSTVAGQCYFVGDHKPDENLFDFMEPYLRGLDLPVPRRSIPYRLALVLAAVAEIVAPFSNFNRFAVIQTCVDHTFSYAKAERDLGYRPVVSREEAFARSLAWLRASAPDAAAGDGRAASV
jgi:3beta-hydroxy-Delta5-steroid dehydrogenase / steroid Delta-isomerase